MRFIYTWQEQNQSHPSAYLTLVPNLLLPVATPINVLAVSTNDVIKRCFEQKQKRRSNNSVPTAVADPDLGQMGAGGRCVLLTLPAFLPSVTFSFFTQNKGGGVPGPPGPSPRSATVQLKEKISLSCYLTFIKQPNEGLRGILRNKGTCHNLGEQGVSILLKGTLTKHIREQWYLSREQGNILPIVP